MMPGDGRIQGTAELIRRRLLEQADEIAQERIRELERENHRLHDLMDEQAELLRKCSQRGARLREELAGCIMWHLVGGLPEDTDYEAMENRIIELEGA
jgi:hypothetical protein